MRNRAPRVIMMTVIGLVLGLCPGAFAGQVATIRLADHSEIRAEIVSFDEGVFALRNQETGRIRIAADSEIFSIDFGETPTFAVQPTATSTSTTLPARMPFWGMLNRGEFMRMARWCQREMTAPQGPERLRDINRQLGDRIAAVQLTSPRRRDHRLAQGVVLAALGDREEAIRLFRAIRLDYPNDQVVRQFEQEVEFLRKLRERRGTARE